MRKLLLAGLLVLISFEVGCFIPIYDSSKEQRTRQLINVSESFRHIPRIWERVWNLDMPDLQTPYRTHGGVI